MTRQEYEEKSFYDLMNLLYEVRYDFHTREDLKELAKHFINEDDIGLARHILDGIDEEWTEFYQYDYTMGTLAPVHAITKKEDVEHLIDGREEAAK